jgi:hypothetical protein
MPAQLRQPPAAPGARLAPRTDRPLRLQRWLNQSERDAESFAEAFDAEPIDAAGLHAVRGRPMWPSEQEG